MKWQTVTHYLTDREMFINIDEVEKLYESDAGTVLIFKSRNSLIVKESYEGLKSVLLYRDERSMKK